MKRLGIFLGFTPKQMVPHEGIARLIGFIVKGATESGDISVTLAGPSWLKPEIIALLDDANVPRGSVEIVTTRKEPYIVKIWRVLAKIKSRDKKPKARKHRLKRLVKQLLLLVVSWLSTRSTLLFVAGCILLAAAALILAIPLLLVLIFLAAAFVGSRTLPRVSRHPISHRVLGKLGEFKLSVTSSLNIVDRVRESELKRLIGKVNRRKDIDVWYVPSMFWPEVSGLQGKVVMAAPDIVFYEHPSQYTTAEFRGALDRISASVKAADHLICYSDYVRQNHMVERQHVPEERVSVIRHGFVDTSAVERGDGSREASLDVLHSYLQKKKHQLPSYLAGFRFDDVPFLFYSSQVRPHKNIEGLVITYEKLLREHFRPVKLVLTGRFSGNDRIAGIVRKHGLERDVISLPSVPNDVLAALYRLSCLSVNPTMFEGGFPFTFAEGYSVGTPSIMSRIPVVTEIIKDESLLDMMTFDPRDRDEMLKKILWGMDNADALYNAQRPLFDSMSMRTWTTVADEYLGLMRKVAEE
ncbi:glycosyltransferase [Rhizobium grahamii]|uniref:Glycosyl transferase, group 1 family protein n=1 Tax=Rhizobium grahamii CCGE 502 TaxID=990285 RepID=S3IDA7_9HYPH|nr:glycosyltransferase [Rhizobium grahamii]EPE97113.1 glycosyl transferase, group 1 family protein [Rhizobium grahamii CCGE 502]